MQDPSLPGFSQFAFTHAGKRRLVYHTGAADAAPVLLLQELPGLAPGLVSLAERLAAAGFHVYLPWLFGPLGRRTPLRNYLRLCIAREFGRLRAGVSAPVTLWLRALVTHISAANDDCAVAAIGMCVTGGFAIPLLLHPKVRRAVAAQPAIPVSLFYMAIGAGGEQQRSALNVSAEEINAARKRLASGAKLLTVRCAADRMCAPEKITRLRREFPVGLTVREYGEPDAINAAGERPHATYTKEFRLAPEEDSHHFSRVAFEELVEFLRAGRCGSDT